MRNLLYSDIWSMGSAIVRPRQGMTWWMTQSLTPKDGGGIEDKVVFGSRIDHRCPFLGRNATSPYHPPGHFFQSWYIWWIPVVLPADQSGDCLSVFDPRIFKYPMTVIGDFPIPASVLRTDIADTHKVTFIGTSLGKRSMPFFPQVCPRVVSAVRSSPINSSIFHSFAVGRKRRNPADCIPRKKHQTHSGVPHFYNAFILPDVPVFIVPYAEK